MGTLRRFIKPLGRLVPPAPRLFKPFGFRGAQTDVFIETLRRKREPSGVHRSTYISAKERKRRKVRRKIAHESRRRNRV